MEDTSLGTAALLALLEDIRASLRALETWMTQQAQPIPVVDAITGAAPGGTIADVLGPVGAPGVTRPVQAVAVASYPTLLIQEDALNLPTTGATLMTEAFVPPANGTVQAIALPATGTSLALQIALDGQTFGTWTPALTAGQWNGPYTLPVAKGDQIRFAVSAPGELAVRVWFQAT